MNCPICKLSDQHVILQRREDGDAVQCPRCGNFAISGVALAMAEQADANLGLSAWLRGKSEAGSSAPLISREVLTDLPAALPKYKVSEKQLLLMRAIEVKSKHAGETVVVVPEHDFTLAWCSTAAEFLFLLRALVDTGLLQVTDVVRDLDESFVHDVVISPAGWAYLEERDRPSMLTNQVFIAMSFDPGLRSAWEHGIRPGIKKAGFSPYRIDTTPHIDRIDAKIISEIRNSSFLVADVTLQRPGVYFEAGFAIGLGLPVFWTVREDELANVHFDTRQYNHIVWKTEAELAERLYDFVSAIIGAGTST